MPRPIVEQLDGRMFLSAGELDSDFGGGDGIINLGPKLIPQQFLGEAIFQPDGSLLIESKIWRNQSEIRRFDDRFRYDRAFGAGSDGGNGRLLTFADGWRTSTFDVAVQSVTRRILRLSYDADSRNQDQRHTIQASTAAGSPDPTFGDGGKLKLYQQGSRAFRFSATHLFVDPDGKIVVAGSLPAHPLVVRRYLPDGAPDESYGDGGQLIFRKTARAAFSGSIHRLPDGRLVVVGERFGEFSIARYRADGHVDKGYGQGGVVRRFMRADRRRDANLKGRLLFNDGTLIVAAVAYERSAFAIRFDADGRYDKSFGVNGRAVLHRSRGIEEPIAVHLAAASDGRAVFTLNTNTFAHGDVLVGRLTSGGKLDPRFGDRGITRTDLGGSDDPAAIHVDGDGDVLVIASSIQSGLRWFAKLVKFKGN